MQVAIRLDIDAEDAEGAGRLQISGYCNQLLYRGRVVKPDLVVGLQRSDSVAWSTCYLCIGTAIRLKIARYLHLYISCS